MLVLPESSAALTAYQDAPSYAYELQRLPFVTKSIDSVVHCKIELSVR